MSKKNIWASRCAHALRLFACVGLSAPSRAYIALRFIYARGSATIPLATRRKPTAIFRPTKKRINI
jgi:hypothetical protein